MVKVAPESYMTDINGSARLDLRETHYQSKFMHFPMGNKKEVEKEIHRIDIMQALCANQDQFIGFLRGKVVEYWEAYELYNNPHDLKLARLYRDTLAELLPNAVYVPEADS